MEYGATSGSDDGPLARAEDGTAPGPSTEKPEKKKKPKNSNDLKTAMGNERTFFKYLWTGLHVGTMGTWLLKFYSEPGRTELGLVIVTWVVAFFLVGYGLYRFYHRRWAMTNGYPVEEADSPFAVVLITGCVTVTVGGVVAYLVTTVK
mmetsp:Transcript_47853/g.117247  ORF Transcript_47853/g.117247 Transcript_47853/m.117247 type:complete len:148 (-) Transcript_47853:21-464(-)